MMGSSKYEFEPEEFEKDYNDKLSTAEIFKNHLREVLYREYQYRDGSHLTKSWRRILAVEVLKEYVEED